MLGVIETLAAAIVVMMVTPTIASIIIIFAAIHNITNFLAGLVDSVTKLLKWVSPALTAM